MAGKEATITGEAFYKSLAQLEALAGNQQPQQDLNKSQICTGGDSDPGEWAGSSWTEVPGNGPGADKIKPDGTDYNERAMRKSIQEKVSKGLPLTADELALLKSDLDKGDMGAHVEKASRKDDDKENFGREMDKSIEGAVHQSETLQKGIEVSDFLAELAKAFSYGLQGLEARTEARLAAVEKSMTDTLAQFAGEQGEFNKSLAEAVVNIGHGVSGAITTAEQAAQVPVGAPKSHLQVVNGGGQPGIMNKSFAPGQGGEQISKSMMLGAMTDMLEKGQINPVDVIKFDTTGDINPALQAQVVNHIQAGGR